MEKGKLTASTKRYRNSGWAGKHLPRKSKKAPTPTPAMVVAVERSSAWMEQKEPKRDFGKIIISIGRKQMLFNPLMKSEQPVMHTTITTKTPGGNVPKRNWKTMGMDAREPRMRL